MSTIFRLKREIDAAAHPATDSPDGLRAFREVWALGVDEGRKQHEALLDELRDTANALATENERPQGTVLAAQNRAADLHLAKTRAEAELSRVKAHVDGELQQAKTAFSEASTQTAGALQKLAAAQAAHATQVATLQADLANAVRKAHELQTSLKPPFLLRKNPKPSSWNNRKGSPSLLKLRVDTQGLTHGSAGDPLRLLRNWPWAFPSGKSRLLVRSELELQLVRTTALMHAKAVKPPTPQSRKIKHPRET